MSNTSSGIIRYKCWFDHGYEPCNGHTLEVQQHHTSDTVSIISDGEIAWTTDDGGWNALMAAIEALRLRNSDVAGWKAADEYVERKSVELSK